MSDKIRFMLCPVAAVEGYNNYQTAHEEAEAKARKYPEGGGFVIFEVREIGRFETVAPVWIPTASNGLDDEIPF